MYLLKFGLSILVGIFIAMVGSIVVYISMYYSNPASLAKFDQWTTVAIIFFLTGMIGNLLTELVGINEWYCNKRGTVY
jgi:H+/Cl- antiporter ClcA